MNKIKSLVVIASLLLAASVQASIDKKTHLTIYSKATPGALDPSLYRGNHGDYGHHAHSGVPGYAVVRHVREVDLEKSQSILDFTNVAGLIDPTTVSFKSLTHPDATSVLEQSFNFDLVSHAKLLQRYLGMELSSGSVKGKLLSFTHDKVLLQANDGRVYYTDHPTQYPELPGGLITKPTLTWMLNTQNTGTHDVQVSYQTQGITWWTDYNLTFKPGANENQGLLDVGAWVSIVNQSGAGYDNADLKLVAGDVQKIAHAPGRGAMEMMMDTTRFASAKSFEEKAFFEYHLYTLGRTTNIPNNSTKQIELFPQAQSVPVTKDLVYAGQNVGRMGIWSEPVLFPEHGQSSNKKVDIFLSFNNAEANNLGIPLPKGRVRVSQLDKADGNLEFIGEDVIDHTPKNEKVQIKLGSAFDVVGERKQTDYLAQSSQKWLEEAFEIKVRNHKDKPVKVIVKEFMSRWNNWEILSASHQHKKIDTSTIEFPIEVAPDGETTVTYRVRYTW